MQCNYLPRRLRPPVPFSLGPKTNSTILVEAFVYTRCMRHRSAGGSWGVSPSRRRWWLSSTKMSAVGRVVKPDLDLMTGKGLHEIKIKSQRIEKKVYNAQKLAIILAMMMFLATTPPCAPSLLENSKKSMYRWISTIENGVQGTPSVLVRCSGQWVK